MKLLAATTRTQGQRDNDFHWCVEGELVIPPVVICNRDRNDPDGGCGCGRAFAGLASHRATTTAMVRELEAVTARDYVDAIRSSLDQQGWSVDGAEHIATDLIVLADAHDVGAVLEHRLGDIRER